ncbi:immunoglobulin gamma-1 heavy chain-like [Stegostoma tigrinum]|uniref:immunoglobulin gamma-1 heavy chain-like n=1 Tax=Stegostoma tigrinum TaxID=3053191 RepID=UPI0028708671|nr:immunoglobulin gamma-1 heavy chain-like [Stegostoma tigrinum]
MGILPYLCVLLLCLTGVRSEIVLNQPESVVKKPGESHKLICSVSGFSLDDYWMHWVRQVPGKGLEWLLNYKQGGRSDYAPGIQGRFVPSRGSTTVAYLTISELRMGDTAIYYCARHSERIQSTVLGYWGSGTFLEVTSDAQTKPSVYVSSTSCDTSSNQDQISLHCLVKDFQPRSIQQTWSSDNREITTGFNKYPTILGQNTKYTMSSVLSVSASDWNAGKVYHCKVGYKANEMVEAETTKPQPQSPHVFSVVPSWEMVYNQTTAALGCILSGFYPDIVQVSWFKAGVLQSGAKLPSKKAKGGTFETVSYLTVQVADWKNGDEFTCAVSHEPTSFNTRVNMKYQEEVSVFLRNPSIKELWINKTATLVCTAVCSDPSQVQITWKVNRRQRSKGVTAQRDEGTQYVISQLQTTAQEWESGVEFVCSAQSGPSSSSVSKRTRSLRVPQKSPEVRLLPPPAQETKNQSKVTLECVITGFYPDLIQVSWEKDSSLISSNTHAGLTALEQTGTFSVRHYLTVSTEEWRKGSVFTCAVSHPPSNFTSRKEVKNVQDECLDTGILVTLSKPPFEEIWRNKTATILCEILHHDLQGVRVTWKVDGIMRQDGVKTQGPKKNGHEEIIFSRLTVPAAEWESGVEYMCLVEDENLPTPEKRFIRKAQVEVKTHPQLYLLAPSPVEMETAHTATLVCLVTGFSPADIYLAWMANDTLLKTGFIHQPVTEDSRGGWNSGSHLTVSAEEWDSGTTYSCVVGHESVTTNVFRSMNKSHSKPNLVNVSLVLTESFTSCS